MVLGEIPGLALDRTGVALLGAIALLTTEQVSPEAAWDAVDVPTIMLLFGLMVVVRAVPPGGLLHLPDPSAGGPGCFSGRFASSLGRGYRSFVRRPRQRYCVPGYGAGARGRVRATQA